MNPSQSFELLVNLPLQITVVILACLLADRSIGCAKASCQLWTVCFAAVLGLPAAKHLLADVRRSSWTVLLATASADNCAAAIHNAGRS